MLTSVAQAAHSPTASPFLAEPAGDGQRPGQATGVQHRPPALVGAGDLRGLHDDRTHRRQTQAGQRDAPQPVQAMPPAKRMRRQAVGGPRQRQRNEVIGQVRTGQRPVGHFAGEHPPTQQRDQRMDQPGQGLFARRHPVAERAVDPVGHHEPPPRGRPLLGVAVGADLRMPPSEMSEMRRADAHHRHRAGPPDDRAHPRSHRRAHAAACGAAGAIAAISPAA
jgi:hypothetical protein